jgi:hypothetical protein
MGFFDRFSDSKFRSAGESLAAFAFSMCNHDQIHTLLTECNFSEAEKIRFRFDFFIANLVLAVHAVNSAVGNKEKLKK